MGGSLADPRLRLVASPPTSCAAAPSWPRDALTRLVGLRRHRALIIVKKMRGYVRYQVGRTMNASAPGRAFGGAAWSSRR